MAKVIFIQYQHFTSVDMQIQNGSKSYITLDLYLNTRIKCHIQHSNLAKPGNFELELPPPIGLIGLNHTN